jgi:ketosteroid isomerase-like protein
MSENVDLVRSIYADWERGNFFEHADWAHPEIEYVQAGGPDPHTTVGVAAAAERVGEQFRSWQDFKVTAQEIRDLDDERVLVLVNITGRGKSSGVEIEGAHAHVLRLRDRKVTRFVLYFDRDRALADLGVED